MPRPSLPTHSPVEASRNDVLKRSIFSGAAQSQPYHSHLRFLQLIAMTTQTASCLEFRCSHCWHSNFASLESVDSSVACSNCNAEITVPEATPARLRTNEYLQQQQQSSVNSLIDQLPDNLESLSDNQLAKLMRSEDAAKATAAGQGQFMGFPTASLMTRFLALTCDGIVSVLSFIAGVCLFTAAVSGGLVRLDGDTIPTTSMPAAIAFIFVIPLIVAIYQWNGIVTRGQTIGKQLMRIRIVTCSGYLPNFLFGVVVRNWVRNLFNLIPLFWLLDCIFAWSNDNRSIHDLMAGTQVVTAD
jgi:uncharacterized RDD family membrane protein YckC/DNA-directed RNA polymerase subunit RPC12/RpoP